MKLTEYMKKAESIYKELSPKYIEAANAEKAVREEIYNVRSSREYTREGKEKRIAQLQEQEKEYRAEMAALAATAKERAQQVRDEVESRFYGHFHASADAMDMKAIELLKSGILTDTELKNLADQYNGNATMLRIIGKNMEERPNRELQQMGRVLQANASDPHLKCIDSIIHVGDYCMGGAPLSKNSCEAFLQRFDEMTAQTYAAAPDVEG